MAGYRNAFALSKAELANSTPPGTVTLIEHVQDHDELRLVPQPSVDPADPLNFTSWRKITILASMSLLPFLVNFTSASISSALPVYAATPALGLPPPAFSDLTQLIAVNILLLGASNFLWVPLANSFGRRPIILLSLLLLVFSSMWAGLATDFNNLLAARALMGAGGGPADAVAPDVVGEIFFVHQRGRAMAIYTVFLATGSLVGAISGGYLVELGGLRWLHWTNVIMAVFAFMICFFFQPETLYDRNLEINDPAPTQSSETVTKHHSEKIPRANIQTSAHPPYTFARSMKIGTSRPGVAHRFLGPWLVFRLPGVWLVSLWYSGLVGATVAMSTLGPQLVSKPPYLWGHDAGLINCGGLVGTFLGCLYAYFVADWTTKRMAKKDIHGFSEPESRLLTALLSLFIATFGCLIFGFVAQNPSPIGWVGLQFGMGMVSFGLMQAPSVGFNYLIESYPSVSGDCFVSVTSARAVVAFAWTFFVGDWAEHRGPAEPFGIFGMLMGLFGLLTLPVWLWGKRLRIATAAWVPAGTAE